jgi:hypothetical protein
LANLFKSPLLKPLGQINRNLPSFGSFGWAVSEEKIFQISTNQKQELPVVAMFINSSGRNERSS